GDPRRPGAAHGAARAVHRPRRRHADPSVIGQPRSRLRHCRTCTRRAKDARERACGPRPAIRACWRKRRTPATLRDRPGGPKFLRPGSAPFTIAAARSNPPRKPLDLPPVLSDISVMTEITKLDETTRPRELPAALEHFVLQWGDLGGKWGVN